MDSNRLKKAKAAAYMLDWEQFLELEKYMRKRRETLWKAHRAKKIKEKEDEITSLPAGTKVVFTDTRYALGGKIATIVRHLGKGSRRTVVDFGEKIGGHQCWRALRKDLSTDVSDENIKRLNQNKRLGTLMTNVLNKVIAKESQK